MKIVNGDILTVTTGVIVHQVNCMGVMGVGLARQIAKKYPKVEKAYERRVAKSVDSLVYLLGYCQIIAANSGGEHFSLIHEYSGLFIANLFGQFDYSLKGRNTEYCAVNLGLSALHDSLGVSDLPVYFPYKLGCGYGGGDWKIVEPMIESWFPNATLYKYDK